MKRSGAIIVVTWMVLGCGSRTSTSDGESAAAPAKVEATAAPPVEPAPPAVPAVEPPPPAPATPQMDAAPAAKAPPKRPSSEEAAIAWADMLVGESYEGEGESIMGKAPSNDLAKQVGDLKKGPGGHVTIDGLKVSDEKALPSDKIVAKIKSVYMDGVLRCYRPRLEREPTARRKVRIPFTIGEKGKVVRENALTTPGDGDLGACLRMQVPSWRFAVPRNPAGEPITVDVVLDLTLSP